MSNSHVKELCEVSKCIFKDALLAFPALGREFERDLTRLLRMAELRGVRLFTVDLPAVGRHLDRCLSNGQYKPSALPLTKRYTNGVVIPKFLRGLYLLVFEPSGRLKEGVSSEAILFLRQLLLLGKKVKLECPAANVDREVAEFVALDSALPKPEGFWDDASATSHDVSLTYRGFYESEYYARKVAGLSNEGNLIQRQMSSFLANLDFVSRSVCTTLGSYDPDEWCFRHGPGAISEVTGHTNKYTWRNWSDRLENVYPIADYGFYSYSSWAGSTPHGDVLGRPVRLPARPERGSGSPVPWEIGSDEPFSRLVAVPKDFTKPRLIAAEPSEHMWCQQNIWHFMCERVGDSWIGRSVRFRDQSHNQELCIRGSIDDSMVTLDLSAASDRVTCHAVGQMFRCNAPLLLALQATRTRFLRQTITQDVPEVVVLRKFSTMGNACTFPVESLLFFSIAVAAILTVRKVTPTKEAIKDAATEVAVFGDDIVAPKDSRELLKRALVVLDFKVNVDKSYEAGRFRESCGVDAYAGANVTPTYLRSLASGSPEAIASVLETCNHFYQRWFLNVAQYLASTLPVEFPLVAMDSGVSGLKSRVLPDRPPVKGRWNEALQRMESLIPTISGKARRTSTNDDSAIHQFFVEKPDRFVKWVHGVQQRTALKLQRRWVPTSDLGYNPD